MTKIRLAGYASSVFGAARSWAGLGNCICTSRGGIRWNLDIKEGIDFAIYFLGRFERTTAKLLDELIKEGDIVLDIGANIGAHALPIAKAVGSSGHVFAFEPTNYAFGKLTQNLASNPLLAPIITAEQIMLTAGPLETKQAEFYASWPLAAEPGLHKKHCGKLMSASLARAERLDDYVKRKAILRIDVIKMDVDGYELGVLKGAMACIKHFRPRFVAEIAPYAHENKNASFDDFIECLKELKYVYRTYGKRKTRRLDASQLRKRLADGQGMNVILMPE